MKFSRKYVLNILTKALTQGATPRKLAVTCALGIVMGIFPVWGTTTLICLGISILFRLNVAVLQLVNYLMVPLQILLIIPFIQAGSYIFNLPPFPYDSGQLINLFRDNFWLAIKESGFALFTGVGVWFVVAVPLFFVLFFLFFLIFSRWKRNKLA